MSDANPESGDDAPARVWPAVVKLKHPVEFGSERIVQLEFRRGRMGDAKGLKLSTEVPTEYLNTIASRLSGQPLKVIELLDMDDAGEVNAIALDFYERYLAVGKKG